MRRGGHLVRFEDYEGLETRTPVCFSAAAGGAADRPVELLEIPPDRAVSRRPVGGGGRRSFAARTYYFGAVGGGVFKTTDGGLTWVPVSDGQFKTGSVGAIAVADSDPNVIYVGMGEACVRGNASHGDGVYKSVDARADVAQRRAGGQLAYRRGARASEESRHRLRGGAGAPVGAERNARRLPHHGRRRDLEAGAASAATTPARWISRWTRSIRACSMRSFWQVQPQAVALR